MKVGPDVRLFKRDWITIVFVNRIRTHPFLVQLQVVVPSIDLKRLMGSVDSFQCFLCPEHVTWGLLIPTICCSLTASIAYPESGLCHSESGFNVPQSMLKSLSSNNFFTLPSANSVFCDLCSSKVSLLSASALDCVVPPPRTLFGLLCSGFTVFINSVRNL